MYSGSTTREHAIQLVCYYIPFYNRSRGRSLVEHSIIRSMSKKKYYDLFTDAIRLSISGLYFFISKTNS